MAVDFLCAAESRRDWSDGGGRSSGPPAPGGLNRPTWASLLRTRGRGWGIGVDGGVGLIQDCRTSVFQTFTVLSLLSFGCSPELLELTRPCPLRGSGAVSVGNNTTL